MGILLGAEVEKIEYQTVQNELLGYYRGTDYTEPPESYVLFVCGKDQFNAGESVYHLRQTLNGNLNYDDGTHKIFYVNGCDKEKLVFLIR